MGHPVDRPIVIPAPPTGGDDDDRRLFVVVIVLPCVLLLLLTITLLGILFHSCRHPLQPRFQTAHAVVTTKYQASCERERESVRGWLTLRRRRIMMMIVTGTFIYSALFKRFTNTRL
eukprot:TRINITY_DN68592_c1_g1_i1.p1 TRINITY_DN68592_c1_g1~~TRINITY_DN68592_c1_g1_i1.p1  ORF type:complete len:117 (+),score=23.79 TRINITY_DN68592_c1_g1_i1:36-386(+)